MTTDEIAAKLRKLADYYSGKGEHPEWGAGRSPDIVTALTEAASVISETVTRADLPSYSAELLAANYPTRTDASILSGPYTPTYIAAKRIEVAVAERDQLASMDDAAMDKMQAMIREQSERIVAVASYAVQATDVLQRIRAWDVLNPPTDDGCDARFWRGEIDAVLARSMDGAQPAREAGVEGFAQPAGGHSTEGGSPHSPPSTHSCNHNYVQWTNGLGQTGNFCSRCGLRHQSCTKCPTCNGSGDYEWTEYQGDQGTQRVMSCGDCSGTGERLQVGLKSEPHFFQTCQKALDLARDNDTMITIMPDNFEKLLNAARSDDLATAARAALAWIEGRYPDGETCGYPPIVHKLRGALNSLLVAGNKPSECSVCRRDPKSNPYGYCPVGNGLCPHQP